MLRVIHAEYVGGLRLRLSFSDGATGVVDLNGELDSVVFRPIQDPKVFREFVLTDHTVTWPCGADFAPEFLHSRLQVKSVSHSET